jgi:hypothetical protein
MIFINNINIKRFIIKNLKLFYIIYIIMADLNELNNGTNNKINNEIIYEENTDVDSEEIENELIEENNLEEVVTEEKKSSGFDFSQYYNINSLLILLALLGLVYFLFKDEIHKFLQLDTSDKPNLCA